MDGSDLESTLDRVLVTFKLFKNTPLLAKGVLRETNPPCMFQTHSYWTSKRDRPRVPRYRLKTSEEILFPAFWRKHIHIKPKNFAVYRFHLADFRPYLRDCLVDHVESLEYLLVPDSNEGGIGHKFRTRGCLILSDSMSPSVRKRTYERLRDEYAMRSALVHGDEKDVQKLLPKLAKSRKWKDALPPIRHQVRKAIRYFFQKKCLDNVEKRKELVRALERDLTFRANLKL